MRTISARTELFSWYVDCYIGVANANSLIVLGCDLGGQCSLIPSDMFSDRSNFRSSKF